MFKPNLNLTISNKFYCLSLEILVICVSGGGGGGGGGSEHNLHYMGCTSPLHVDRYSISCQKYMDLIFLIFFFFFLFFFFLP